MGRAPEPLGLTDCERIRSGRIAQPVNTASSALLILVGGGIAARARRRSERRRAVVLGSAVATAGLGSVIFHGPGGRIGHWLHDATIAAMVAFPAVDNLRAVRAWDTRRALGVYGAVVAAAGGLLAVRRSWVQELPTALGVIAAATEVAARRRRQTSARRMHLVGDGLWVAAGAAYFLGRTESPLCRPDSLVQLHGAWHVLAGAAVAAWAEAALEDDGRAGVVTGGA